MISIFYDLNKVFKALGSLVPKLLRIRVICVIDSMPLITTLRLLNLHSYVFYISSKYLASFLFLMNF